MKVIWAKTAQKVFNEILIYWKERNGNNIYSRKISNQIYKSTNTLSRNPLIGLKTNKAKVRKYISGNYAVFYEIKTDHLQIKLIWDTRRNPEDFKI